MRLLAFAFTIVFVWMGPEVTGKNTKASKRARTRNYNFECD